MLWFGSYYTAKFEKFLFFAQNSHVADVVRLPFGHIFDSSHTNLIEAWKHQCWDAPKDRVAFHLFLIEIEHRKTSKIARFECLQKRAIWHMSHTGAWWILRFKPYKPNRSLKASMLRCSKRQSSFSFVFDWNRASENINNSTFWVPSKTCYLAHVAHRCLMDSSIARMKIIMKDGPQQCWRAPRIIFAFHWDLPILSAHRGCPHSQSQSVTVEGVSSTSQAGLKKRLQVLPTARWRARAVGSVNAEAGLLVFAF